MLAGAMGSIYRAVLDALVASGFPQGGARVRLSKARKAWIALQCALGGGL